MNTYNTSTYVKNDAEKPNVSHTLNIAEKIALTGISNVDSMREECVIIKLKNGGNCTICGKGLFAEKLDTAAGEIVLVGKVDSVKYAGQSAGKKELMKKLFK